MVAVTAQEHAQELRALFLQRLLAHAPASVLDVGCGTGALLAGCAGRGVRAVGVETAHERLAEARAAGRHVVHASAEALPFHDGSHDWVAIRHVLHHLRHPRRALAEAARVARTGIALAEPWRDTTRPDQQLALDLDRWCKREDRRLGQHHVDDLSPEELASALPEPGAWELSAARHDLDRRADLAAVVAECRERLAGRAVDDPVRRELDVLLERAERTGVGRNGTAFLIARRQR